MSQLRGDENTPGLSSMNATWHKLYVSSAGLVTIIGMFLVPPPFSSSFPWPNIAKFFIAIIIGLTTVNIVRERVKRKDLIQRWWRRTVALASASLVLIFAYYWLQDVWTLQCIPHGYIVVIGSNYTPDTERYAKQHPGESECAILLDTGDVEKVWPPAEIVNHQFVIAATYVFAMLILALSILSLVHTINIATSKNRGAL